MQVRRWPPPPPRSPLPPSSTIPPPCPHGSRQVDKLVQLLESPIFVHLRLQLLEINTTHHADLLKSLYGLLMLLPQSQAYKTLSDRLVTVSALQMHVGFANNGAHTHAHATATAQPSAQQTSILTFGSRKGGPAKSDTIAETDRLDHAQLLFRFEQVQEQHTSFRLQVLQQQKRSS